MMNTGISSEAATPSSNGTLTIEGKQFGRGNRALFPNFEIPVPAEWQGGGAKITLQTLIEAVVRAEVAAFKERQEKRTVLQALTAAQIAEGVAKGKIDSGGTPDAVQEVSADEAVATALQAFEDGVYYVFINDEQKQYLTDEFSVGAETRVTFLRLVALAGG